MHAIALSLLAALSGSALAAASAPLEARAPPKHLLRWVCTGIDSDDIPDVCNNMCYATNCKGNPIELYWDKPDTTTQGQRSRKAGCGGVNKCDTTKPSPDQQCDEYPFKSTRTADTVSASYSRCVPRLQNNYQGQALRQFYNSQGSFDEDGLGGKEGAFSISFGNVGGIRYCGTRPNCANDGHEFTQGGLAKRSGEASNGGRLATGGWYRLSNNETMHAPGGANVGDIVHTPKPINRTLSAQYAQNHVYDPDQGLEQYEYMQHNMYTEQATVLGPA
ncbi:Hypothetical predicted protein [Lecanosticta acicola]|uniref:Deoxyribonuclease NucA/NucB domain-containing protein n=1 Tax=Lecanosticta acicola TaxID=111012 RepID=A0AAI8YZA2_9PEZI|nr:Hypothetical predicted protein [Lecanosticta acicola]